MFARALLAALLPACLLLTSCSTGAAMQAAARPASASELVAHCDGREGWSDPALPVRIHANSYWVGTCGISAILIASPDGHVLIDGATGAGAPHIAASIERLGFRLTDIRLILASHEHFDHVGGLAELQRRTGAEVRASPAASPVLASGRNDPSDPQAGRLENFAPVRLGRPLADGEVVAIGPIRLTAHLTPGHSPGGTSWSWRSCEAGKCVAIAYLDSISAISNQDYRFSEHPAHVAAFRASLDKMAALPCDILVTPHPSGSNLLKRLVGEAPLIDRTACASYAARGRAGLDQRLASESRR